MGLRGVNSPQNSEIEEVILRGVKTPQDEGGGCRSWVSGEPTFLRLVGLRRRWVSGAPKFLWILRERRRWISGAPIFLRNMRKRRTVGFRGVNLSHKYDGEEEVGFRDANL